MGEHVRDHDTDSTALWPGPQDAAGEAVDVVVVVPSREVYASVKAGPRES